MLARGVVRLRPTELQESRHKGPVSTRPYLLLYSQFDGRSSVNGVGLCRLGHVMVDKIRWGIASIFVLPCGKIDAVLYSENAKNYAILSRHCCIRS